jgi:hypothetical protein
MPWMCVDQSTGFIYVVYYDRSNYVDQTTDVYLSWSVNGGQSFNSAKVTALPFFPPNMYGDYIGITAFNNVIHPIWAQENNGVNSIWTASINYAQLDSVTGIPAPASSDYILNQNYPNPFSGKTFTDFYIPGTENASFGLYDAIGNRIAILLDEKSLSAGWHHVEIDASAMKLSTGIYYLKLQAGNFSAVRKMIVAGG